MSVQVVVQFVGGPADQKTMAVPGRMFEGVPTPPHKFEVVIPPRSMFPEGDGDEALVMPLRRFRYWSKASPLDTGPRWLYVPAPEHADDPEPMRHDEYERLAQMPLSVADLDLE